MSAIASNDTLEAAQMTEEEVRQELAVLLFGKEKLALAQGIRLIYSMLWLALLCVPVLATEALDPAIRRTLVLEQRHRERLFRSAEARFTVTAPPNTPENVALLREFFRLRGSEGEHTAYVLERGVVHRNHWWRSGRKGRIDKDVKVEGAEGPVSPTSAFDGTFRRRLGKGIDGKPRGAAITRGHVVSWSKVNRLTPLTFLYQYAETPYSEILEKGGDFKAATVQRNGKEHTQIDVRDPSNGIPWFRVLLDKKHRLVERQLFDGKDKPNLYQTHRFAQYRAHEQDSGEAIWFPHRAEYVYYVGRLPDGRLVPWRVRTIVIEDIRFNVPIPHDTFVIAFPPGIPIGHGRANGRVVKYDEERPEFFDEAPQTKPVR